MPVPLTGSQQVDEPEAADEDEVAEEENEELLWEEEVPNLDTTTKTIGENVVIYQLTGDIESSGSSSVPPRVRNSPPGIFIIFRFEPHLPTNHPPSLQP